MGVCIGYVHLARWLGLTLILKPTHLYEVMILALGSFCIILRLIGV